MSNISAQSGNILGIAGKTVEGVGNLISARQEIETGDFNASILSQRAEAERTSQQLLEEQKRIIVKNQIGTQVSLFGKSGVTLSGSPIEVLTDSLTNANFDIAIDRYNSEVAARGFETEASRAKIEAGQRASLSRAKAGASFLSAAVQSTSLIGNKGQKLGAGTTTHGIRVPSRTIPPR